MKTDAELQRVVMEELQFEPRVGAAQIRATVQNGTVTLTGSVPSFTKRLAAERAAKRVLGVEDVADQIEISPAFTKRTDPEITRAAANALEGNVKVPGARIKVAVEDGSVKLEGDVDWCYQIETAQNAVECLPGVKSVANLISVKSMLMPAEIKSEIETAFESSPHADASQITVVTEGSKVILNGRVRSWAEREVAVRAAWAAPGVTQVVTTIQVRP